MKFTRVMSGLRSSEIAALTWNDLEESENENLLIHVRTSKTNRAGEDTDIRLLKNGFAKAVGIYAPAQVNMIRLLASNRNAYPSALLPLRNKPA